MSSEIRTVRQQAAAEQVLKQIDTPHLGRMALALLPAAIAGDAGPRSLDVLRYIGLELAERESAA